MVTKHNHQRQLRVLQGCDAQGRIPSALPVPAEACTDVGAEADPREGLGVFIWPMVIAAVCVACAALSIFWPFH